MALPPQSPTAVFHGSNLGVEDHCSQSDIALLLIVDALGLAPWVREWWVHRQAPQMGFIATFAR